MGHLVVHLEINLPQFEVFTCDLVNLLLNQEVLVLGLASLVRIKL